MGSKCDVVTSGVVNSGRERGHVNIDANDPKRTFCDDLCTVFTVG